MIPESFIEEVLSRTDIVQVIGRYVKLQHKGSNWMACCPFHKEKTPSFAVNPSKQFFKCFGCGEHGTAITFLMKFKGLSFPEAIKELADDLGMEVPEDRMAKARQAKAKTLTDYLAQAADFYHQTLFHDRHAIEYLKGHVKQSAYYDHGGFEISHEFVEDIASRDLYKDLSIYKNELYIIHGTEDKTVPYDISKKYLTLFHNPVFYPVEGASHNYDTLEHIQSVILHTVQFFVSNK